MAGIPTTYVIDDDYAVRDSICVLLETIGFVVRAYATCAAFLREAQLETNSCLLIDLDSSSEMTVIQLLDQFRRDKIEVRVIVMANLLDRAAGARVRAAVERAGARLLDKPFETGELVRCIKAVLSDK